VALTQTVKGGGVRFSVEIGGAPKAFVIDPGQNAIRWRTAEGAAARAADLRPVNDSLNDILIDQHKALVSSKGASIGHPWPGYNADEQKRYAPWKIKKIGIGVPMFWSPIGAKLIPSLIGHGEHHIFKSDKSGVEYGTDLPYARGHHEGTNRSKKWMGDFISPMRKLIGISQDGWGQIKGTVQRFIITGKTDRVKLRA